MAEEGSTRAALQNGRAAAMHDWRAAPNIPTPLLPAGCVTEPHDQDWLLARAAG